MQFDNSLNSFCVLLIVDIYLIRHGESEANRDKIAQGWLDSPLSELGRKQARNLQKELPDNYDRVYSSPLLRAKETALLGLGISEENERIEFMDDLREINIGLLEGVHFAEIDVSEENRRKWSNLQVDTLTKKYNTEPIEHFMKRTSMAFDKIINTSKENNRKVILIFSHGGTMRSIVTQKLHLITPEDSRIANTEIFQIKYQASKWTLEGRSKEHVIFE